MVKNDTIIAWLRERITQNDFQEFLAESFLALCSINTIPL